DIDASTLGKVPSATNADHAGSADSATSAKNAGHATSADTAADADHATSADTAADAEKLDGHTPGEFGAGVGANPAITGAPAAGMSSSVSATTIGSKFARSMSTILPNRRFRATDFAVHFEGAVQAGLDIRVSLVVDEEEEEVCTLTELPSTCTPSAA